MSGNKQEKEMHTNDQPEQNQQVKQLAPPPVVAPIVSPIKIEAQALIAKAQGLIEVCPNVGPILNLPLINLNWAIKGEDQTLIKNHMTMLSSAMNSPSLIEALKKQATALVKQARDFMRDSMGDSINPRSFEIARKIEPRLREVQWAAQGQNPIAIKATMDELSKALCEEQLKEQEASEAKKTKP